MENQSDAQLSAVTFSDIAKIWHPSLHPPKRPTVCVQGLGFVGVAMALAIADARDSAGLPCFNVIGVEPANSHGTFKVDSLKAGILPIESDDQNLHLALKTALATGNFVAITNDEVYREASVVVVDVHCDVDFSKERADMNLSALKGGISALGARINPDCLVLVETTVPPGTTEKVVLPLLRKGFSQRGLQEEDVKLAHSYERVMPGPQYFDSVKNFWRVFAGIDDVSAKLAESFLSKVINVKDFPLQRLPSTTASETAKVMENSYRAVNIAFIDEWSRFAEATNIDLFSVLQAIRVRPTHNNIRYPGFGVGGYCLTKDPMFGKLAAEKLFGNSTLEFPFSTMAVEINRAMPLASLKRLKDHFGTLKGKKILLMGVSYRSGVGDTRYSASHTFASAAIEQGATMTYHDPLVKEWTEMGATLATDIPEASHFDAVVLAVDHKEYKVLDLANWAQGSAIAVLDANGVLSLAQRQRLREVKCKVLSTGRGDDCE